MGAYESGHVFLEKYGHVPSNSREIRTFLTSKWLWLEFRAPPFSRNGCGSSLADMEGSAEVGAEYLLFLLFSSHSNICAEIAIKHKENAMFERPQLETPVETPRARRLELRKSAFTRQAPQGRGGFNGYRAFRRACATCIAYHNMS